MEKNLKAGIVENMSDEMSGEKTVESDLKDDEVAKNGVRGDFFVQDEIIVDNKNNAKIAPPESNPNPAQSNESDSDVLVIDMGDDPDPPPNTKVGKKDHPEDKDCKDSKIEKNGAEKVKKKDKDEPKVKPKKRGPKECATEAKEDPKEVKEGPKKRKRKSQSVDTDENQQQKKIKFEEVENELAAMFADVVPTSSSSSSAVQSKKVVKPGRKPGSKKTAEKEIPNWGILCQQELLLDKFKGPFVRIEGDPATPRWTHVVNSATDPLSCREEEKNRNLEAVTRVTGFGYSLTTLNAKYDAKKADETWVCVFCKQHSHCAGLGDLFGPYTVPHSYAASSSSGVGKSTSPKNEKSPGAKSPRTDLAAKFIMGGGGGGGKRKRRKSASLDKGFNGSDQAEVWFHEDCVCWMPQLRIVGCQILGLADAIRQSQMTLCSRCKTRGCTVACSHKACRETAHFHCALRAHWQVDDEEFKAYCEKHIKAR